MKNKKKARNSGKKANFSVRRKVITCYNRTILFLKFVLLVVILALFFTNIFDGTKKQIRDYTANCLAKLGFTLKEVIIEGQQYTSIKDIVDSLQADKGVPIFAISITELKSKLEENIWVKAAFVERQLPSTIYIAITERKPIAIWQFQQKLYLIDCDGNRIANYEGSQFEGLMHVIGQDANTYAQSLIDELNKYPNLASKVKSAVRYGQRRWNLNFQEGLTVKMPENDFANAYDYLNSLDENHKLFNQNYKFLDLRDSNKYYLEKY